MTKALCLHKHFFLSFAFTQGFLRSCFVDWIGSGQWFFSSRGCDLPIFDSQRLAVCFRNTFDVVSVYYEHKEQNNHLRPHVVDSTSGEKRPVRALTWDTEGMKCLLLCLLINVGIDVRNSNRRTFMACQFYGAYLTQPERLQWLTVNKRKGMFFPGSDLLACLYRPT